MDKKFFRSKKMLVTLLVMLIFFIVSIVTVFRGEDPVAIFGALSRVKKGYINAAVVCVPIFVVCQGIIFKLSFDALRQKTNIIHCILYAFTGYFYCCITPFQAGGPTMQAVYMKKEKIPISVSSIVLLIVGCMYKLVLAAVGIGVLFLKTKTIRRALRKIFPLYVLGMILTIGFCLFIALLIFKPGMAKKLINGILHFFEKIKILKHSDARNQFVENTMGRYKETSAVLADHKFLMVLIFIITFIQRFVLFMATYFVYKALNLGGVKAFEICILQALVPLCVDLLPIPGGMGFAEIVFSMVFAGIFLGDTLMPGLILSRGITFYAQLAICAVFAIISHLYFGWLGKKNGAKDE